MSILRKKGWKALSSSSAIPSPLFSDMATARSIHVVMVSGTFTRREALPSDPVVSSSQSQVSGKYCRILSTSTNPSTPAPSCMLGADGGAAPSAISASSTIFPPAKNRINPSQKPVWPSHSNSLPSGISLLLSTTTPASSKTSIGPLVVIEG